MIRILADSRIHAIQAFANSAAKVVFFDSSEPFNRTDLEGADALIVRTVSKINSHTLPVIPSRLSFAATASAGFDHVDTGYLAEHGVTFASAGGANARAVAEHVVSGMLCWSDVKNQDLSNFKVGIVGCGHTGNAVGRLLGTLGISTVLYDPLRAQRESAFYSAAIEDVLSADIITFHTPLTFDGEHKTHHWLDAEKLAQANFKLVVNASRGGVIDESALMEALHRGSAGAAIIDVWEGEPELNPTMLDMALLATPHIAGYSAQAKFNATKMVFEALYKHFGIEHHDFDDIEGHAGPNLLPTINSDSLAHILKSAYPLHVHDRKLRNAIAANPGAIGQTFRKVRQSIAFRDEFDRWRLPENTHRKHPELVKLGFKTC